MSKFSKETWPHGDFVLATISPVNESTLNENQRTKNGGGLARYPSTVENFNVGRKVLIINKLSWSLYM